MSSTTEKKANNRKDTEGCQLGQRENKQGNRELLRQVSSAAETSITSKPRKLRNHLSSADAGETDQLKTETEQNREHR